MKVYTRTGDGGQTSLVGGRRVGKAEARIEAYGTVDELESQMGLLLTYVEDATLRENLLGIERALFQVATMLATPPERASGLRPFPEEMVRGIEREMDVLEEGLPQLRCFVVPGGCRAAAVAHVCRTVCRRAERRIWALQEAEGVRIDKNMAAYVNRVSDYLYVLARRLNFLAGVDEISATGDGE